MSSGQVAIVGAGSSGIAAAKILHQRGIPFDCFEVGSGLGGNWRYDNDNGMSSAYRSLHINTSRDRMVYSDFPMSRDYPDFPDHRQILAYFESYVDHFGFRERITFQTRVERLEQVADGGWTVTIRGPEGQLRSASYRAVLVANGHHWCPRLPDFPGELSGLALHSHDYRSAEIFTDRNVLVVGIGNSACDIASEAARVARRTLLSTRRSAHVIPKYLLGRPLDLWDTPAFSRLPLALRSRLFAALVGLARGRQGRYGLPPPDHRLGHEHPTISGELLQLIGHGKISIKPNVERLEGDRVLFADGSRDAVDVAVWATGYRIAFPFLDPALLDPTGNRVRLYRHVVPPDLPGLYFLGLIQPLGAVMPLAEAQAEWVADLLQGSAALPGRAAMERSIEREAGRMGRRYVASPRHTIQVDFYPYLRTVRRERRRGRRRAARAALPPR